MGYKSKFKGSTVEERLRAVLKKQDTLVSGVNIKAIGGESALGSGNLDILYQPIPYQFLLDLRGKGKLKPGQFYRITDYVTTTSQANTRSAGKLFDVIVLALTNDTFAERAWACHRDGSTDFQNSHLEAWQIWYCLDNDTSRFDWVFPTSGGGKGVIYRMIDEFGNDCPYDFKNIQFYRQWDSSRSSWSIISSSNIGTPCYTFSSSGNGSTTSFTDMSLLASNKIYSNVIGKYVDIYNRQNLNNICFFGGECSSNTFGGDCYNNTFEGMRSYNAFGANCYGNTFGKSCLNIAFGNNCFNNTFGNNCWGNTFGNNCRYIKFAADSSVSTKYDYY